MNRSLGLLALLVTFAACTSDGSAPDAAAGARVATPAETAPPASAPAASARPRIVALGDSLTAGLGLERSDAYPALLQQRLDRAGLAYEVVNAGVSGDTSAGALRRLDWALDGDVKVLIVALGGNDGLRGLPPAELQKNLTEIVQRAQARGSRVILAGMEAPPNFGAAYTHEFRQVYRDVARERNVVLVPFLLEGVAGLPEMNQSDGIHPTTAGAARIADTLWRALEPLVTAE